MAETLTVQLVGDLILDEPNPDALFDLARNRLRDCDVLVGHVEVPHTTRGVETRFDVPAPASDPGNLSALARAGFHVATLAGNHIADAGPKGVEDTVAELRRLGIVTTGAGMNLAEARRPALIERSGIRLGVLSYNCVGPRESWAGTESGGMRLCSRPHALRTQSCIARRTTRCIHVRGTPDAGRHGRRHRGASL